MDPKIVKYFYSKDEVVKYYSDAITQIGLWLSEEKIFTRIFKRHDAILEIGTGTGRIAIGLFELGYDKIIGVDYSKKMVAEARRITKILEYAIPFNVMDALNLNFENELFDGVIFGFNGLMQIPSRKNRQLVLNQIFSVLKPDSYFVFTTHDRENKKYQEFWNEEMQRWECGNQDPDLTEFGDRYLSSELGKSFMHVPDKSEIVDDLINAGFKIEAHAWRSEIANEPQNIREFSDDCRFWIAKKPVK